MEYCDTRNATNDINCFIYNSVSLRSTNSDTTIIQKYTQIADGSPA